MRIKEFKNIIHYKFNNSIHDQKKAWGLLEYFAGEKDIWEIEELFSAYSDHNLSDEVSGNNDAISKQEDVKSRAGGQGLEPCQPDDIYNENNKLSQNYCGLKTIDDT